MGGGVFVYCWGFGVVVICLFLFVAEHQLEPKNTRMVPVKGIDLGSSATLALNYTTLPTKERMNECLTTPPALKINGFRLIGRNKAF